MPSQSMALQVPTDSASSETYLNIQPKRQPADPGYLGIIIVNKNQSITNLVVSYQEIDCYINITS